MSALDRHITGNYGELQFAEADPGTEKCQINNCDQPTVDGVLCAVHDAENEAAWLTHMEHQEGGPH